MMDNTVRVGEGAWGTYTEREKKKSVLFSSSFTPTINHLSETASQPANPTSVLSASYSSQQERGKH